MTANPSVRRRFFHVAKVLVKYSAALAPQSHNWWYKLYTSERICSHVTSHRHSGGGPR